MADAHPTPVREPERRELRTWVLGDDGATDIARVAAMFAGFALLDRLLQGAADIDAMRLDDPVLLLAAVRSNPLPWTVLVALGALIVRRRRAQAVSGWSLLDHGIVLRGLVAPLVILLMWQYSLYDVNFLLDRLHLLDRALVIALGTACWWRPALLVPFALQVRIVADQLDHPFGTLAAQNVDELLVLAVIAVAVCHLLVVVTGHDDTAPVLLLIVAALATHFWIPGKGKLDLDWFRTTELSNLPPSAYAAGWIGQGDGGWGRRLADLTDALSAPVRAATLLVELGAVIVAVYLRAARVWLPLAVCFHVAVFAATGFWFLGWIVLEIGLLVVLLRPSLQRWVAPNATPARGLLVASAVVIAGPTLFHPPGLAWLDAPVAYGLEVDLLGASGRRYAAPASMFAPLEQELTFLRLEAGDRARATGAYGAVVTEEEIRALERIRTFAELDDYESSLAAPVPDPRAVDWLGRFLTSLDRGRSPWSRLAPPDHFWSGRPDPIFSFQEPVRRLELHRVRSLHGGSEQRLDRELVVAIEIDSAGDPIVVSATDRPEP